MRARDLDSALTGAADGRADRAVGRAPTDHQQLCVARLVVDLELGDVGRDALDLPGAQSRHRVVVVRVVRDRPGSVLLLEAADAMLEPLRARAPPTDARGSADRGGTGGTARRRSARRRTSSRCPGSVARSGISHGSEPLASPASERRYTGVRYFSAMRAASIAAWKHCDGLEAATIGTGLSEFRPKSAISRSACSGLVGIPVDGPARWMSRIRSGSSSETARPIVSALRTMPGPDEAVIAERAAEGCAEGGADRGDLVLGLEGDHAEVLARSELLEDRRGRRDRVGAEKEVETRAASRPRSTRSRAPRSR